MKFFKYLINNKINNKGPWVTFLTDIEGNLDYFQNWISRSNVIDLDKGNLVFKNTSGEDRFVFGGDFCHRGSGDLSIGRLLCDFKDHHPDKVTLIAGKHEIKSHRFTSELDAETIRHRLIHGAAPFWSADETPKKYLMDHMKSQRIQVNSLKDLEYYLEDISTLDCQTVYLKWMLDKTMGCHAQHNKMGTFEYRKRELAFLKTKVFSKVTDQEVTQSFIDSVAPKGVVTRYLKNAQLGAIIGDTLFVHGAVTVNNMGFVPGMSDDAPRISCPREWIATLNAWYQDQIAQWLNPNTQSEFAIPGKNELIHYVLYNPRSIVTSNWYVHGQFAPIDPRIEAYLVENGINRVVSGQQPVDDFPLIIRNKKLEVLVGDTSCSDILAKADTRGIAIHNLEIKQDGLHSKAFIHAIRNGGRTLSLELPWTNKECSNKDQPIGQFTKEGKLIRPGRYSNLVACSLDGFNVIEEPIDLMDQPENSQQNKFG